jgi:glycosyltransferase involved in cell wall biosynthesis
MKVSLVIPAYNEEKHIEKCLQCAINQDEKTDEIIVVDNNCTDKTVEIAKKYGARIVKEERQGMIYARNAGFNAAKYEIIARTDADTKLPKDWILKIKNNFKNDPKLGALSGPTSYREHLNISKESSLPSLVVFDILSLILKNGCLYGPNMSLRKVVWEKVRDSVCLDDKKVHEDIDLSIHLNKLTKIKFDHKLIVETTRIRWRQVSTEYPLRLLKMLYSHRHLR